MSKSNSGETSGPTEGDRAPDFTLPFAGTTPVGAAPDGALSLSELGGRMVILYFYPRDDTPGCTTEALDFTARAADFARAGAAVIGVSKDTVAKHDKFIAKHGLDLALVSDAEGSVCEDYGVWVEKNMYGEKSMGVERATYLIDGSGVVRRVWRKVKVAGHVEEVLAAAASVGA